MKKIIVALSLVLASGYVANTVYAAIPTVKSEMKKDGDGDKDKKKSKSTTQTKSTGKTCTSGTEGKSCCAGKK